MYGQPGITGDPLYFVIERRRLLPKFSTMSSRRRLDENGQEKTASNFITFSAIVCEQGYSFQSCVEFLVCVVSRLSFILKTMLACYSDDASNEYSFDIVDTISPRYRYHAA